MPIVHYGMTNLDQRSSKVENFTDIGDFVQLNEDHPT